MAIKFKRLKIVKVCEEDRFPYITSQGGLEENCWMETQPIREWQFSPSSLVIRWAENTPIPTSELITIVFPEVEKSIDLAEKVRNIRYVIKKDASDGYTLADVMDLHASSGEDLQNIRIKPDGKVAFRISFKNFNRLKQGENSFRLYLGVLGDIEQNGSFKEEQLERRLYEILIKKVGSQELTAPYITTDKPIYKLTYIKSTGELVGDTQIVVGIHNLSNFQGHIWARRTDSFGANIFDYIHEEVKNNLTKNIALKKHSAWDTMEVKTHHINAKITFFHYDLSLGKEQRYTTPIQLHLTIKAQKEGFEVDKKAFEFKLFWHENKTAQGSFLVNNHGGEPLSFEKSDWITLSENGNEISFETLSAQNLKIGRNQGYIKVKSGDVEQVIGVVVLVEKTIENSLDEVNFCLDKKEIRIRRENSKSEFLKAHFSMTFSSYQKPEYTIEQTYEYVFFDGEIKLFPGEEVQDFFDEMTLLNGLKIKENDLASVMNLFKACKTEITISEYDSAGNVHKTQKLPVIYFLPGRKPKAYPFLTNGNIRRTYSNSLISVSALQEEFLSKDLGKITGNSVDTTAITLPKMVVNLSFRRSLADKVFGAWNIIKKDSLELLPIPNTQKVIDVLFQNQNFCPDWFSFSGEWELNQDITHTISENMQNGNDFKAHAQQKTTLKLNTGWLLEEEIPLLNELILSPVCFIRGIRRVGNMQEEKKWIRAIPINKKSLVFDNQQNVRSFVVEFEISE